MVKLKQQLIIFLIVVNLGQVTKNIKATLAQIDLLQVSLSLSYSIDPL
jgi:hypothetical protein